MGEFDQVTGQLILILGPSGTGKGTILEAIRENHPEYVFPVSCTTREPRPGEEEGEVYNFVSKEEFQERMAADEFLEWAVVHGENYYGTLKEDILGPLREGKTVIREVDVQGVRSIRELIPDEHLTTIFITVDSWETLRRRILRRGELPEDEMQRRHESFLREMKWQDECDLVIQNLEGQVEKTIEDVENAISGV